MYLASPRTSSSWRPRKESFTGRIGSYRCFTSFFCSFTDGALAYGLLYSFFTDMEYSLFFCLFWPLR
jgi:hypothetical protein